MKALQKKESNFCDEEGGTYIGVPLEIMNQEEDATTPWIWDKEERRHNISSSSSSTSSSFSWTCCLISNIQIITFTFMIFMYGFAPITSNPFIGPPLEVIDAWGSKNPYRIIHNNQYWRVVTAIFLNVGLMDLLFSIFILCCFAYHLERRWGNWKLMLVYLLSGMNILIMFEFMISFCSDLKFLKTVFSCTLCCAMYEFMI